MMGNAVLSLLQSISTPKSASVGTLLGVSPKKGAEGISFQQVLDGVQHSKDQILSSNNQNLSLKTIPIEISDLGQFTLSTDSKEALPDELVSLLKQGSDSEGEQSVLLIKIPKDVITQDEDGNLHIPIQALKQLLQESKEIDSTIENESHSQDGVLFNDKKINSDDTDNQKQENAEGSSRNERQLIDTSSLQILIDEPVKENVSTTQETIKENAVNNFKSDLLVKDQSNGVIQSKTSDEKKPKDEIVSFPSKSDDIIAGSVDSKPTTITHEHPIK